MVWMSELVGAHLIDKHQLKKSRLRNYLLVSMKREVYPGVRKKLLKIRINDKIHQLTFIKLVKIIVSR
jgi:hypothetical protein